MNLKNEIKNILKYVSEKLKKDGLFDFPENFEFEVEYPEQSEFGDYSSNIAMRSAKFSGKGPREIADKIKEEILKNDKDRFFKKVEIAGPGFLNFYLSEKIFFENIKELLKEKENYGKNELFKNKKIVVEYTDPNPFKEFHIGHLMPNIIGESISRLLEFSGADIKRVCYQGDVGMHVAMAVYGMLNQENIPEESDTLKEKAAFLGASYAFGAKAYKENEEVQKEIKEINKKIFEKSDKELNDIYNTGRQWSLDYFETLYKKLGTKFDEYFFESETGEFGKKVVEEFLEKGVFEKSEGAVIFPGEKYGLHTRVFISSEGLPTYEAKELGLAKIKYEKFGYDESIIVTGNEINEYFKVLLKTMSLVYPELAEKTKHIGHGMLRLPTGKMSSRTGDVITAENLIAQVSEKVRERSEDSSDEDIEKISVAAIKYAILKQKIGKDIIFDLDRSISFEGDSGPYLLYSYVRTRAILRKAEDEDKSGSIDVFPTSVSELEKMLARFSEVVELASRENAPHYITSYLIELTQAFNSYYAKNKIVEDSESSPYRIALTKAVSVVLENGLKLLGLRTVERM